MRRILLAPLCVLAFVSPAAASQQAGVAPPGGGFGAINYLVLGGYLVAIVAIGAYFSRRKRTTDDYFLAGRRVPWWAAGLSIFGGGLSALTYMGVPGKAFAADWAYLPTYIIPILLIPVVIARYVPFYRRLRVTTAYEYLEKRFNLPARMLASAYFILFQLGRMAIVLYLPAVALATVTGLDLYLSIVLMGILAATYTVLGGVEAVIWTDVIQVIVLAGGAFLALFMIVGRVDGGLGEIIAAGAAAGKFRTFHWGWDPCSATVWVMVTGSLFSAVMPNTADHAVVQRYLTTRDERSAARAAWTSALLGIPTGLLFFFMGTCLFVFYRVHHAESLPAGIANDQILPFFVMQQLPMGLAGLVVAGIFAASMSSIDSGINAVAAAFTTDLYRRLAPGRADRHYLWAGRVVSLLAGVIATGIAVGIGLLHVRSAFELFYQVLGLFGGTLAGLFILGIFTRRTGGPGALVGVLVSAAVVAVVRTLTPLHIMHYAGIGLVTCVAAGYLASLAIPAHGKDLTGLTMYSMPPQD